MDVERNTSAKELGATLRETTVDKILQYIDERWNSKTVRVHIAKDHEILRIPNDWHGAMKHERENGGDALVLFGTNLIDPIEGTSLPAESFISGLRSLHFTFENGNAKRMNEKRAATVISSTASCKITSLKGEKKKYREQPVFRAIKDDDGGKIVIEIRNGSMSPVMQELTIIGNDNDMNPEKKLRYRQAVNECLGEFSAKGASTIRKRLKLDGFKRLTYFDDCLATGVTIFGDQEVDAVLGRSRYKIFEEIRVSVASTQGIALAVKRSLDRRVPLLIRVGALSYGLGGQDIGLNYLVNTQSEMKKLGLFTVGDMGDKLSTGREPLVHPHIRLYKPGKDRNNYETRIFLGGGLAMLELWEERIMKRKKDPDTIVSVLHASRINPPPGEDGRIHDWGVLLNGKRLPYFQPPTMGKE